MLAQQQNILGQNEALGSIESLDVAKKAKFLPVVGCMPNCTKNHKHVFDYNYKMNYRDPIDQRPGEYKEINWKIVNDRMQRIEEEKARADFFDKTMITLRTVFGKKKRDENGVCEFGFHQTPIDLQTDMKVKSDFQDEKFQFQYENIDPKTQLKFKEAGEQFQIVLKNEKGLYDNYLQTATISLFDSHIKECTLFGL